MSDIKKIRVDEVDYDIKDLMARSGVNYIESTADSPVYLRDLTDGVYVLNGNYFYPFSGSSSSIPLTKMLACIDRWYNCSYIMIITPYYNKVRYMTITDSTLTEDTQISLSDLQNDIQKKAEISYGTDDMIAGETALETGKVHFVYESGETV